MALAFAAAKWRTWRMLRGHGQTAQRAAIMMVASSRQRAHTSTDLFTWITDKPSAGSAHLARGAEVALAGAQPPGQPAAGGGGAAPAGAGAAAGGAQNAAGATGRRAPPAAAPP
jgi:hypothetical protein